MLKEKEPAWKLRTCLQPCHQPPRTVPSQNRPPPYPSRTHPNASRNPPCNSARIFLHENQNSEPPQPQPWSLRFTEKSYLHYLIAFWGKIKAMQKRHGTWSLPRQRLRKHLGKGPSLNATHPLPQVKWEWEKKQQFECQLLKGYVCNCPLAPSKRLQRMSTNRSLQDT